MKSISYDAEEPVNPDSVQAAKASETQVMMDGNRRGQVPGGPGRCRCPAHLRCGLGRRGQSSMLAARPWPSRPVALAWRCCGRGPADVFAASGAWDRKAPGPWRTFSRRRRAARDGSRGPIRRQVVIRARARLRDDRCGPGAPPDQPAARRPGGYPALHRFRRKW